MAIFTESYLAVAALAALVCSTSAAPAVQAVAPEAHSLGWDLQAQTGRWECGNPEVCPEASQEAHLAACAAVERSRGGSYAEGAATWTARAMIHSPVWP